MVIVPLRVTIESDIWGDSGIDSDNAIDNESDFESGTNVSGGVPRFRAVFTASDWLLNRGTPLLMLTLTDQGSDNSHDSYSYDDLEMTAVIANYTDYVN